MAQNKFELKKLNNTKKQQKNMMKKEMNVSNGKKCMNKVKSKDKSVGESQKAK